jgi:hypothetical protein
VEWYWRGKLKKKTSEKNLSQCLCPPQMPHEATQARNRASAVRGLSHGTILHYTYIFSQIFERFFPFKTSN